MRHNAVSSVLTIPGTTDMLGLLLEENWPPALKFVQSLKKFPGSEEPGHAASMVSIRAAEAAATGGAASTDKIDDPSKGIFDYISTDEKRVARFRAAMAFSHSSPAFFASHFVNSLPWADKGQCPETVVDIGGAGGELCQLSMYFLASVENLISNRHRNCVLDNC